MAPDHASRVGAKAGAATAPLEAGWLETDRRFDILTPPASAGDARAVLAEAAERLGTWRIHLAGMTLDAARLRVWSEAPAGEPLLRFVREDSGRAIDLPDLLYFLDDVLRDGELGLRGQPVWLTPGRARKAGVLVHPDDVFEGGRPRRYGADGERIPIEPPPPRVVRVPARDGDPPSADWTARYPNPEAEADILAGLAAHPGAADFAGRVRVLMTELRRAGADASLNSALRSPERGYLMWGAFMLGRARDAQEVESIAAMLDDRNARWRRDVVIRWRDPAGWQATRRGAQEMADAYQVVYATEAGARASDHYAGRAVDLVAIGLPRSFTLRGPDGAAKRFDLSDPEQTRDLSLTPEVIRFVEGAYGMRKLEADYPHWIDAASQAP